jgi:hypothetical protein
MPGPSVGPNLFGLNQKFLAWFKKQNYVVKQWRRNR